jgi:hypothetical protein
LILVQSGRIQEFELSGHTTLVKVTKILKKNKQFLTIGHECQSGTAVTPAA